jgi:FMN phosphatase YigB (HAD superfamily)
MAPGAPLEVVLLDVGGTLLTESPRRWEIYAEAARTRGLEVEPKAMRRQMAISSQRLPRTIGGHFRFSEGWFRPFIERIFVRELGLEAGLLPELEAELLERFRDPGTFRLYPHALELLEGLRGHGLALGIVSNWSEALPGILAGLGVAERVDFCLVSALERAEKPEPEIFLRALERAGGGSPERTVHAGNDVVLDVRGARDCGMLGVLVDHGHRAGGPPGVPRVGDLRELEAWILERAT